MRQRLRILLSEGSSTSAREAITALGLAGHHVEICDPDAFCIGRWSRFVRRFHRCPGLRDDPAGFRDFILDLVAREKFDVLLPIHEQGLALSKVRHSLARHVAVALPDFASYARLHSKLGFSRILDELGLPQPPTRLVASRDALLAAGHGALVVKLPVGTASRGVWLSREPADLVRIADELESSGAFAAAPVLVQDFVDGPLEHAQAVFAHGELVACHGYAQRIRGLGGGEALKESVDRPQVRRHMAMLGQATGWHGALSVDYILADEATAEGTPRYFDCNPRLVEPMAARLAGLDLAEVLVRISLGAPVSAGQRSQAGIRTKLSLQAVLGTAARTGSRRAVLASIRQVLMDRPPYNNAAEELTPFAIDPFGCLPTVFAALFALGNPSGAAELSRKGWGRHLLDDRAVAEISAWPEEPENAGEAQSNVSPG
jgi:predicted ATP-grasp superfamily ATP-dependent carboligase